MCFCRVKIKELYNPEEMKTYYEKCKETNDSTFYMLRKPSDPKNEILNASSPGKF